MTPDPEPDAGSADTGSGALAEADDARPSARRPTAAGSADAGPTGVVGAFVWWEFETAGVDEFRRFHGAMWGWEFRQVFQDSELGRDYWLIIAGGEGIGGLQRALTTAAPRAGTRLYVEVDDLEATLDRAVALGAEVERARTELGGDDRWFANMLDPSGVSIGLWTANPA